MNIGFIGLGKLGFPVAVGLSYKGHAVMGYDRNPMVMTLDPRPYRELGPDGTGDLNAYLADSTLTFGPLERVIDTSELLFVCIQTPHDAEYDGTVPAPFVSRDFEYSYLIEAVMQIDAVLCTRGKYVPVVIISTVLPGTLEAEILPCISEYFLLLYSPFMPAMGSVIPDFYAAEFYLIGCDNPNGNPMVHAAIQTLKGCYQQVNPTTAVLDMSFASAEMTKVVYNTWISMKIILTNTVMELCHKTPHTDCDAVMSALRLATRRICSPRYMVPGMSDGGACHPRDLIALSYYAEQMELSANLFETLVRARESQTKWLAELALEYWNQYTNFTILGYAFKAGSTMTEGSPALLLYYYLHNIKSFSHTTVTLYDPYIDNSSPPLSEVGVYILACHHPDFQAYTFPAGSVVIDPFRCIPPQSQVKVISVGRP